MDLEGQKGDEESDKSNERVVVISPGNFGSFAEGNGSSGLINDVGSSRMLSGKGCNEREIEERFDRVDLGSGQQSLETVVGVSFESVGGGNEGLDVKDNGVDLRRVLAEEVAGNVCKEEGSCVIGINGYRDEKSGDDSDGEVVCRICHLSADQSPKVDDANGVIASPARMDLIQLGCECKDELGTAHRQCAEAWFKLKGNRSCEICGEIAKNITCSGNSQFVENWNGRRFATDNDSGGRGRCWQGQSLCNFCMAFMLPTMYSSKHLPLLVATLKALMAI